MEQNKEIKKDLEKEGFYWLNHLLINQKQFLFNDNDTLLTNINIIDNYLNGLAKDQLYIFAGRPSVGKTTFLLNVLVKSLKNLKENEIVIFFSLEMSAKEILARIIQILKNENEEYVKDLFKTKKLLIIDYFNQSVNGIKKLLLTLQKNNVIKSVFIDHLQLLDLDKKKNNLLRYEKITQITRELKIIAKNLHTNFFVISQLSRDIEKRKNNQESEPQLSDLRDSGAIEQDADVVIFLSRIKNDEKFEQKQIYKNLISIAKNRNGRIAKMECLFKANKFLFIFIEEQKKKEITKNEKS